MVAGADGAISLQAGLFLVVGTRGHAAAASFFTVLELGTDNGRIKAVSGLKGTVSAYFFGNGAGVFS